MLRVHPSNFTVTGFTAVPDQAEVATIAHRHAAIVIDDLGSGALLPTERFGLAHEPTPGERLAAGSDVVTFSGDKLVGGPQAGLVVGRADLIARMRRDPLARAMRPDKATLLGVAATLGLYRAGLAVTRIPVWAMIALTADELRARAEQVAAWIGDGAQVVPLQSTIGGGSLPGETIPSFGVAIDSPSADRLLAAIRRQGRSTGHRADRGWPGRPRPADRRSGTRSRARVQGPGRPPRRTMTVVIGTAGHIDHGKTTLLRALTGIDADRLPEERRRGMTIDVGYAHLALPDGTSLDFVDVPGHDRLVGNMLVGAGEIDAAMLVVAADDGPRAQTLEHLALLDALRDHGRHRGRDQGRRRRPGPDRGGRRSRHDPARRDVAGGCPGRGRIVGRWAAGWISCTRRSSASAIGSWPPPRRATSAGRASRSIASSRSRVAASS